MEAGEAGRSMDMASLAWKGWMGVGFSLPSFPGLSMTKSLPKPKRGGKGVQDASPTCNFSFGDEQQGKWGEGGSKIDIELLPLICGVAYAMVGRCNPA